MIRIPRVIARARRRLLRLLGRPQAPRMAVRRRTTIGQAVIDRQAIWHPLRPEAAVAWPELRRYGSLQADFARRVKPRIPELGVLELSGGYFVGDRGWILTKRGRLLPETSYYAGGRVSPTRLRSAQPRSLQRLKGTAIAVASDHAGSNYGHFLLDSLPRFALLEQAGIRLTEADHILAAARSPGLVGMLVELGVPPDRLILGERNVAYQPERLVATTFPGTRRFYEAWQVDFLRERLAVPADRPYRRLYIPRSTHRRITNADELLGILRRYDFEVFEPGPDRNPRKAFAEAAIVVGGHGAGLADIVFCRPGSVVLELLSEKHPMPYFATAAVAAGLDYGYLMSPVVPQAGTAPHMLDYHVDPTEFAAALEDSLARVRPAGSEEATSASGAA